MKEAGKAGKEAKQRDGFLILCRALEKKKVAPQSHLP